MHAIYRRIAKIPNYVRRFGVFDGLRLLMQIERGTSGNPARIRQFRVPGHPAAIHLRDSLSDHTAFWQCLVMAQYDLNRYPQAGRLLAAYRRAVEQGNRPLIIDCGGNVGMAAVWFATQFPEAIVCSIEPDRENLKLLEANVACFAGRVRPLLGGIWYESGTLRIANPQSGAAAYRVRSDTNGSAGAVPAYTIDQICALAGVESAFIVKIDIEGAQQKLFQSNTEWVARTHLITLELDDWLLPWNGTSRPFFACLSRYPFDYLLGGESIFCFRDWGSDDTPSP